MAREVVPRDPALHRACVPLAHALRSDGGRVLCDPLHRALSPRHLRLQPRCAALDVARRLLLVRRARHRPLPAVHARRRPGLPRPARNPLSGAALARPRPCEVVAARDPALRRSRDLPGKRLRGVTRRMVGMVGLVGLRARPHRRLRLLSSVSRCCSSGTTRGGSSTSFLGSIAGSRASPPTCS